MPAELLRMMEVSFTASDVKACTAHLREGGVRFGCPVCFLRGEYLLRELLMRLPLEVASAREAVLSEMRRHEREELSS